MPTIEGRTTKILSFFRISCVPLHPAWTLTSVRSPRPLKRAIERAFTPRKNLRRPHRGCIDSNTIMRAGQGNRSSSSLPQRLAHATCENVRGNAAPITQEEMHAPSHEEWAREHASHSTPDYVSHMALHATTADTAQKRSVARAPQHPGTKISHPLNTTNSRTTKTHYQYEPSDIPPSLFPASPPLTQPARYSMSRTALRDTW